MLINQSSFTFASVTTLRQRSTSAETILPNAGPVTSGTSEPLRSHASLMVGVCMAVCSSLTILSTIAGGVFFGANRPYQVETRSEERRVGKERRYRWSPDP